MQTRYAELHVTTNFTFLEGASHPDELVHRAAQLGYEALAVTDRNSLAGVVRAHAAAKQAGLKLLVGAEITPEDAPPVVLWAADRASYGRLARLITIGRRRAPKGQCRLRLDDVAGHAEGLIAGIVPRPPHAWCEQRPPGNLLREQPPEYRRPSLSGGKDRSAGPSEPITKPSPPASLAGKGAGGDGLGDNRLTWCNSVETALIRAVDRYRAMFGDRCYLLVELHQEAGDWRKLDFAAHLARRCGVPPVAAGDVHYHIPQRQALHNVLAAIRHGITVAAAARYFDSNAERHLQPVTEIMRRFRRLPEAIARTEEIAARCNFSLDQLRYEYPEELVPEGLRPIDYLRRLTWQGARDRYPRGVPEKVCRQIEHELQLIEQLGYEAYFLTVWDLVRLARTRGILCQGRGSAANSAVCYCLGITAVDPERIEVLFERFVSRERNEAPDIDVDFEHHRREEVLQYIYQKYGRDRAGMTAEVITYRVRSAVRDVGKALGLSLDRVDRLAGSIEHFHHEPNLPERCREAGIDPASPAGRRLVALVDELVGFPRHLSQHTGGMVITRGPLCEVVPLENAAMEGRTVIQWNKDDLDALGILKVDCLALGMLTAVRRCLETIETHYGRKIALADIPEGDPHVYAMICRADTVGVFQIESRAQMNMLPRLRPQSFYDLVIEVAIVRPGPIQGNMVHPYLRRRAGLEQPSYPNEVVRQVLEKTLGVPLFQEQVMRLAIVAAGFAPGQADQLRRAMGAWRRPGLIDQFRKQLLEGMCAQGIPAPYAQAIFEQVRGFGEYGFPESHAASFALLVYASAWLKHYYQAAFTVALLNSQPMGFYAPAQLVRDAQQHGVEVRPIHVNFSSWESTLEAGMAAPADGAQENRAIRLGFHLLSGLRQADAERIVQTRGEQPFASMKDFTRRTRLGRAVLVRLAQAGALAGLAADRRTALWHAMAPENETLPLFDQQDHSGRESQESSSGTQPGCKEHSAKGKSDPAGKESETAARQASPEVHLPKMQKVEEMLADYRSMGLSLDAHPMQFLREKLAAMGVITAGELKRLAGGTLVRVAGVVLVRQRPGTAKGITFITLEDETGQTNLIVRPPVWKRWRTAALRATILLATGRVERQDRVVHVLCTQLADLSRRFAELDSHSRDFC